MKDIDSRSALSAAKQCLLKAGECLNAGDTAGLLRATAEGLQYLSGDNSREARILEIRLRVSAAFITFESEGIDQTQTDLDGLRRRAQSIGDLGLEGVCISQSAIFDLRSGRYDAAYNKLKTLQPNLSSLPVNDQLKVLLNRATAASMVTLGSGAEDLAEAARIAAEHGMTDVQLRATHNQGYVAYQRGDLPAALALMREADDIACDTDRVVSRMDHAQVLFEAGLIAQAETMLTQLVNDLREAERHHTLAEVLLERARARELLGDADQARDDARRARTIFASLGASVWAIRARLMELVSAPDSLKDDVAVGLREVVVEAETLGDLETRNSASLAIAEIECDPDLLPKWDAQPLIATRLRVDGVYACDAFERGDYRELDSVLARAAADLRSAASQPASLDLRTAAAVHARHLASIDVSSAMGDDNPGLSVFQASERWRCALGSGPAPVRVNANESLSVRFAKLRSLRDQLRDAPPSADTAAIRLQMAHLEDDINARQRAATSEEMNRDSVDSTDDDPTQLDATERLRCLEDALSCHDRILVSFIVNERDVLRVTVVPGEQPALCRVADTATMQRLIARLRADLTAAVSLPHASALEQAVAASLRASASELDEALFSDADLPSGCDLTVVPALDLGNVPWLVLPSRRGLGTCVAKSAHQWVRTVSLPSQQQNRIVALGGPGLDTASDEVNLVRDLWSDVADASSISPHKSGLHDLHESLNRADIVHVAAHGEHRADSPLFSSLRLGTHLAFAHELQYSDVNASHVILASCEGGTSTVRPGDAPMGWAATLISMGVKSVVAPVCAVRDSQAYDTMRAYHQLLTSGKPNDRALAEACADQPPEARVFMTFGAAWSYRASGSHC